MCGVHTELEREWTENVPRKMCTPTALSVFPQLRSVPGNVPELEGTVCHVETGLSISTASTLTNGTACPTVLA